VLNVLTQEWDMSKALEMGFIEEFEIDTVKRNASEVLRMLTQEWDMEKALEMRYIEGQEEAKIKIARRMLAMGESHDVIARCTELPLEKIKLLKPLAPDNAVQIPQ
jgi:predicted transposase/invertase (TIGR01784 family)